MIANEENPAPQRERCPYCGCGFVPAEPGQVYCSPLCEQQHRLDSERRAGG